MESEKKPSAVSDMGAWAMNVISSVGIIMANKQLMASSGYGFSFGLSPLSDLILYSFLFTHCFYYYTLSSLLSISLLIIYLILLLN